MRGSGRRPPLSVALAVVAGLILTGCGTAGRTASGPRAPAVSPPSAPATVGSIAPGPATTGSAPASPTTGASSSPGAIAASTVPIDPALMDLLPATVAGLPVTIVTDPSGTDDPGLVASVDRMVEAVVIDPPSGDFAYASVVEPRPGVFDDAWFRSWRDSFDEGACSQAGGVAGHAEATIGGRRAYIGRCAGGVLTYHVRLSGPDQVISVSSLGDSRLGEQLLAGLRP